MDAHHQGDQFLRQLLVALLGGGDDLLAALQVGQALLLDLGDLLPGLGNPVEGIEHLGQQRRLHGREGNGVLLLLVLVLLLAGTLSAGSFGLVLAVGLGFLALGLGIGLVLGPVLGSLALHGLGLLLDLGGGGLRLLAILALGGALRLLLGCRLVLHLGDRFDRLVHGVLGRPAAVGGVEVDDVAQQDAALDERLAPRQQGAEDRKSTRLNSSH